MIGPAALTFSALIQSGCTGLAGLDDVQGPSLTLASMTHPPFAGDRSLQEREFFSSRPIAFSSAMTVLADLGFRPTHADASTGFITAIGSGQDRIALKLSGLTRSSGQTLATVFFDSSIGDKATVRIVFARSLSGSAKSEATQRIISDAEPYNAFFQALEHEIEARNGRIGTPEPGFIVPDFEETSLTALLGLPDHVIEDAEQGASVSFDPDHSISQSSDQSQGVEDAS